MKPTLGLIPQQGICPICLEFDSAGPIARSPRDIALLMDVLVDPSQNAKPDGGYASKITGSFDGIRIGVLDPKEWHLPPIVAVPNSEVYKQQVSPWSLTFLPFLLLLLLPPFVFQNYQLIRGDRTKRSLKHMRLLDRLVLS